MLRVWSAAGDEIRTGAMDRAITDLMIFSKKDKVPPDYVVVSVIEEVINVRTPCIIGCCFGATNENYRGGLCYCKL